MVKISKMTSSKVAASTILEVVIALVVIVMVLGISLMIYSNVMRLSLSGKKLKAQFVLQQVMLRESAVGNDLAHSANEFSIEQEVLPYGTTGRLRLVHLTAYDENHEKVAELKKVIIDHEKHE